MINQLVSILNATTNHEDHNTHSVVSCSDADVSNNLSDSSHIHFDQKISSPESGLQDSTSICYNDTHLSDRDQTYNAHAFHHQLLHPSANSGIVVLNKANDYTLREDAVTTIYYLINNAMLFLQESTRHGLVVLWL